MLTESRRHPLCCSPLPLRTVLTGSRLLFRPHWLFSPSLPFICHNPGNICRRLLPGPLFLLSHDILASAVKTAHPRLQLRISRMIPVAKQTIQNRVPFH